MELADIPLSWPVLRSRDIHRDAWVVGLREDVVQRPGHPETMHRLVDELYQVIEGRINQVARH